MGKDMGYSLGEGDTATMKAPGQPGRGHRVGGPKAGGLGAARAEWPPQTRGGAEGLWTGLVQGPTPPVWSHLAQVLKAFPQQPGPVAHSPPLRARRVILKRRLDSTPPQRLCPRGRVAGSPHSAGWLASGSGHSTAHRDQCWHAAPACVCVRPSL